MPDRSFRKTLFFLCCAILLSLSATTAFAAHRSEYSAFEPAPTGNLRVTLPTVAWRIVPGAGTRVTAVRLTLNSAPVGATYDPVRQAVWYLPTTPLRAGAYAVHCSVTLDDSLNVEKDWRFTVAPGAVEHVVGPDKSQIAVCDAVNDVRRTMRLAPLTIDPRLCAAASGHTSYLVQNQNASHDQRTSDAGFVAEHVEDRIRMYGYAGGCFEAVSQGPVGSAAIANLIDAPYHRAAFLQPGVYELGAGAKANIVTLLFGTCTDSGVAIYPADGQVGVPVTWNGVEQPSPMRVHPEWKGAAPQGYIISLYRFGPDAPRLTVSKAVLTTDDGKLVPVLVNSSANDDFLQYGVLIMPQQKLHPGATYHVAVEAVSSSGDDCSRKWSFTTAPAAKLPLASLNN